MKPFLLAPSYQDYLWGGERLKQEYHKQTDLYPLAESWELSAHPDGPSVIASGELSGMPFSQFAAEYPQLLGHAYAGKQEFPLLIKLIDAEKVLSIQVHPDDDYAREFENGQQGKEEMWYLLDCKEGASLYFGFREQISREEFGRRLSDGTITEVLNRVPVKKGDVFFIEAGIIHAIGEGIVVAEIQQNSNLTYRVHDFNRLGPDGKSRSLQLDKALAVTSLAPSKPQQQAAAGPVREQPGQFRVKPLVRCRRFSVDLVQVEAAYTHPVDPASFVSILCVEGAGTLRWKEESLSMQKGDSIFVPSDCEQVSLMGTGEYLFTYL